MQLGLQKRSVSDRLHGCHLKVLPGSSVVSRAMRMICHRQVVLIGYFHFAYPVDSNSGDSHRRVWVSRGAANAATISSFPVSPLMKY